MLFGWLLSSFHTWHICVVKIGLRSLNHDLWFTVFHCSIVIMAKPSTLVILLGSVSGQMFRRTPCIAFWGRTIVHMSKNVMFTYLKAYHVSWMMSWDLLFVIPYCQWQYNAVYASKAARMPTKPSTSWEWLSVHCSVPTSSGSKILMFQGRVWSSWAIVL